MGREEDFEQVRRLCSSQQEVSRHAFEHLYVKYRSRVYNTAHRVMGDANLAADVTQETFLAILRKARKFKFRSAFTSWLYRVTINQCIDMMRKEDRRKPLSLSEPDVASWMGEEDRRRAVSPGPEESAGKVELSAEVARAIAALNPRLSSVVVLRYIEGLGYEEIAEALKVPLGTVKSRLNRAHAALVAELGPRLDKHV